MLKPLKKISEVVAAENASLKALPFGSSWTFIVSPGLMAVGLVKCMTCLVAVLRLELESVSLTNVRFAA